MCNVCNVRTYLNLNLCIPAPAKEGLLPYYVPRMWVLILIGIGFRCMSEAWQTGLNLYFRVDTTLAAHLSAYMYLILGICTLPS